MTAEEFKEKILPHYKDMYRVAASVMRNGSEAVDIVQDAMLKLYDRRACLKDVSDLKAYCMYVVRNACLNLIRDRKAFISIEEASNKDSEQDIHSEVECRDLSDAVKKAMDKLPADQKTVFRLSAYGGFSNAEIAEMLGISQGNVRVLLSRARGRIREMLSKLFI